MGQALEKPKLFPYKKGFVFTMSFLFLVILIRLFFEYLSYQDFISKPFYYTHAKVITAYEKTKNSKRYTVLKLRSEEGFVFYTTSHRKDDFSHKRLRLQLFPNTSIGFREYLGSFYVKSKIKEQENMPPSFKNILLKKVASQHEDEGLKTFYNAIFFATTLSGELREKVSMLGVSHLVALSGFHLGILWGLVYGFFYFFYRPVQQNFFPYRHALLDVGLLAVVILAIYLWFVDFPPSLVRSYAMVLVGWVVLLLGLELLSFTFLTSILLLLVALFPSLLVSLSFWLSVAGVFYIFLLLQYTKKQNKWLISFVYIPFGIFVLMLPIVHSIFGVTSVYQLLSPLLSIIFVPFYPLVMVLHLVGFGDIFDSILLGLFSLPTQSEEKLLALWMMLGYIVLSVGAIWSKRLFYVVGTLSLLYMLYLFIPIE